MNNNVGRKSYFFISIAGIAAFAGILFGYDTGVISGAILFIKTEFQLNAQMNGLVAGAVLLGALLGALFSGRLADGLGRKYLLIIDSIIFTIGTLVSCMAPNVLLLVLGRVIVGVAIGISSYIAPLYISEIAPASHRGALVSLSQLAIAIGILVSYIVDYYCSFSGSWRLMLGLGIVPALCLLIGMCFLPHSPRWMLSRGNEAKALAILRRIRGCHIMAGEELQQIQQSLQQQKANWRLLFQMPINKVLCIGVGLAIIQQVTGINTILYYAPTIFQMAGFKSASASILATMGVGMVFVLFTIIALPLIDRLGRKPLLYIGLTAMAMGLAVMAYAFHAQTTTTWLQHVTVASMILYIAGFAISLGPIMWLMIAELFPLKVRGLGSSIATASNWAANWLVTASFLSLVQCLGTSHTFLLYFIVTILSLFFIKAYVPETKGVSLEAIEQNLYAGNASRYLGNSACS